VFTPKPRAFPRIDFPEREYATTKLDDCPYIFELPSYTTVTRDDVFFDDKSPNECWLNIDLGTMNGKIHCSYYPIDRPQDLNKFVNDAFKLAGKHNIKANYIDEHFIQKENHVSGMIFDIEGPAASPFQFFLTDSTHHFFRAALYFNTQAKPDSMAPVFEFVKEDIAHMINTFEWR